MDEHDDILTYAVIDDADMEKDFPGHFVSTKDANHLDEKAKALAIEILNRGEVSNESK